MPLGGKPNNPTQPASSRGVDPQSRGGLPAQRVQRLAQVSSLWYPSGFTQSALTTTRWRRAPCNAEARTPSPLLAQLYCMTIVILVIGERSLLIVDGKALFWFGAFSLPHACCLFFVVWATTNSMQSGIPFRQEQEFRRSLD